MESTRGTRMDEASNSRSVIVVAPRSTPTVTRRSMSSPTRQSVLAITRTSIATAGLALLFDGCMLWPTGAPRTERDTESSAAVRVVEGDSRREVHGDLQARLQAKLDEIHAAGSFPGACAGFALADGRSFAIATGISDRTTGRALQTSALMLQGSVGKTYVAAVALQLVHEGRLTLDDKIERYLGDETWFARLPNAADITVRMLMNHTSGLVRYEFKDAFTADLTRLPDKVWRPEELVAYVLDSKAPFAAGHGWEYSDTNYIVLGMIVERVTGSKLNAEIRQRLLAPSHLEHTRPSDSRTIPGLSQGYAGASNPFGGRDAMLEDDRMIINPQFEWAGGGYASTAEDLARWGKLLYEGGAFDASLLPQVFDAVDAPMLGRGTRYGLGVIVRDGPLGRTYGHSGFFPGYLTEMRYFAEHGLCVAVQVNTSEAAALGRPLGAIVEELAQIAIEGAEPHEDAAR